MTPEPLTLSRLNISLFALWIEVSYRWFRKREIAEAFAINKLAKGAQMNTKAIEENGKAVAEMVKLLRAKVI